MIKESVLAMLRKEPNYISGEKISAELGVSRTSVNNAIKALRTEGYRILSSTNKGYHLSGVPDSLTAAELSTFLPPERMERVLCLSCVDSTNTRLKNMALEGAPDGQVVLANEQSCGRGRFGRRFASPKDKGIYLSMLLCPKGLPSDIAEITAWTAVAVHRAIETVCGIKTGIKWINDLVVNGRKVGGILTELSVEGESGRIESVIIGIGLNVNEQEEDFLEEIQAIAASLSMESNRLYRRAELAAQLIRELDALRSAWPHEKERFLQLYRSNNITVGKEITVIQGSGSRLGTAVAVNDDFSLTVRYEDGSCETLRSGEVSIWALR